MTHILVGLNNFLTLIEENWTLIIITIGLLLKVGKTVLNYLKLSQEEKIDIALASIKEIIVGLCTTAELDWSDYNKAGSIKRAEVIDEIFKRYPILLEYTDQEQLILYIDNLIDKALVEVRKVIDKEI